MHLNVYTGDLTGESRIVVKTDKEGQVRHGVELALSDGNVITFWGDVRAPLRRAAAALDMYHGEAEGLVAVRHVLEALPAGALGMVSSPVPPYKEDLIPLALRGIAMTISRAAANKGVK